MTELIKAAIRRTGVYQPIRNWMVKRRQGKQYVEWERNGKPVPPPHIVKQRTLNMYARKFGLTILVETGTYYGDMVDAMKDCFERIYSIELSKPLYEKAKARFAGIEHIELIWGDSGTELARVVPRLERPALFWLDGHYSAGETARAAKDTPVYEELNCILESPVPGHVIIIDDARLFGTDAAYPQLEELTQLVKSKAADLEVTVQNDAIAITPVCRLCAV